MRAFILSLFSFILLISQIFAELPIAPGNYNSICFLDSLNGWVCGNNGSIMHTSNGGIDWVAQSSGVTQNLYKIKFIDLLNGWTVGDEGTILHTIDGGINWNLQSCGISTALTSLAVTDSLNAWILEHERTSIIYHTSNAGSSWIGQTAWQNYAWSFTSCVFLNKDTGFVCGYGYDPPYPSGGTIQGTTDGGNNWHHFTNSNVGMLECVSFIDGKLGWAVGDNIAQIKTTDGGLSWNNINSLFGKWLNGVFFVTKDSGWVLQYFTYGNKIHFTSDGGGSWSEQIIPSSESLNEIFFINSSRGWAIGPDHIFYTNDAGNNWSLTPVGVSGINEDNRILDFSLSQNYPNPFNPSTKISWQSPVGSWQTLKVYDVLGNEVATLVNEYRNVGSYEVNFDASKLASGVYYYQLKAGDFIQTKKMILIK